MSPLSLVLHVVVIALAAWFWPHCARPVLEARRAPAAAYWLVFGVTMLTVGVWATSAVAMLADLGSAETRYWMRSIVGGAWILNVGLGYLQNYALLLRVTRTR